MILIGYMGSGKTSVGSGLANSLSLFFLDTDQWIENRQGCTIRKIFSSQGENSFRDMETECLKELLKASGKGIISVGGGLPLREENRRLLKELGQVIYLKARPRTLYERLKGDKQRPLLQTESPEKTIKVMLRQREPFYLDAADAVIEVDEKSVDEVVDEICKMVME